jgi:hypothetical protein
VNELWRGNDRTGAIVGSVWLEISLERLLVRQMRTLSNSKREELFGGNGPLATFSNKIKVAHAFQLLNDDTEKNLSYIREIRNCFAHSIRPVRFKTPEVATVCKLLKQKALSKNRRHSRGRYLQTILDELRIMRETKGPIQPKNVLARISQMNH